MKTVVSCSHEADVLNLVTIGQWPARADEALKAHAAACVICSELAMVAGAVSDLGESTRVNVRLPDASVVWHVASQRARAEARRRAAMPVSMAQAAALAGTVGVCFAVVGTDVTARLSAAGASIASRWTAGALTLTDVAFASAVLLFAALVPVAASLAALADRETDPTRGHR